MMQRALAEETTDGGDAMTIAQPRVAVRRHGVEEECAIAGAPPRDDVEIEALLRADGLANSEETIVKDVVDFLSWRHDDLEMEFPGGPSSRRKSYRRVSIEARPPENVATAKVVQESGSAGLREEMTLQPAEPRSQLRCARRPSRNDGRERVIEERGKRRGTVGAKIPNIGKRSASECVLTRSTIDSPASGCRPAYA